MGFSDYVVPVPEPLLHVILNICYPGLGVALSGYWSKGGIRFKTVFLGYIMMMMPIVIIPFVFTLVTAILSTIASVLASTGILFAVALLVLFIQTILEVVICLFYFVNIFACAFHCYMMWRASKEKYIC